LKQASLIFIDFLPLEFKLSLHEYTILINQNILFDNKKSREYYDRMPSTTVEDYIKQLYLAEQSLSEGELVSMGEISSRMKVQPGTATSMMKTLLEAGLIEYEPRQGVRLTKGGRKLALHILRSHRLIELFLVKTLGYDWSEVHEEAEKLEHVVSEKFISKIDEILGFPDKDPHGDPIPDAGGVIKDISGIRGIDAVTSTSYTIARIGNQDSCFLNILSEYKITPGAVVTCVENNPDKGTITLQSETKKELVLSRETSKYLYMNEAIK
jgi:DtxR family transcriptional regulator, Mn-dependent transcriptional regulator